MNKDKISDVKIVLFFIPVAILISFISKKNELFQPKISNVSESELEIINKKYVDAGLSEKESEKLTQKTFKLFEKK